jgi:HSP20 family protein
MSFPLQLPRELDRLFDELIHRPWGVGRELSGWNPSLDLCETADAFILEADLPGVKADDVKVEVEGNYLLLHGRRAFQRTVTDGRYHYQERTFGDFTRRMQLPQSVDKEKISAEFKDGVLRVVLPKVKPKTGREP